MDNQETSKNIDFVLSTLWIIGFVVALILIFTIFQKGLTDSASLIGAFAILISAGIASASVMKSIYTSRINDHEKALKERERKRIFALNVIKTIQVILDTFPKKAKSQYLHDIGIRDFYSKPDLSSDIQTIEKLINSVFCESILPYLNDDEQNIISSFYSEFYRFLALYRKENNSPRSFVNSSTYSPTIQLHKYVQKFSNFAKSYIHLNTTQEE